MRESAGGVKLDTGWRSVILEMLSGVRDAVSRFPVPALFLLLASVHANLLIAGIHLFGRGGENFSRGEDLVYGLQCGALTALAAVLFAEARGLAPLLRSAAALVVGVAITAFIALPRFFLSTEWTFVPALAGLVLVAPFIGRGNSGSFWMFSARVAFASMLGVLALLLFAGGISAILASLRLLFGFSVPDELHQHVWAFTGLFAAPLFAMGQFPHDFDERPGEVMTGFMDRGMRALGDFVAAPLLIIYAVILHVYAAKIVVTRQVPEGQIGWLVLVYGLCIFGALLIINPFFDRARAPTRLFLRLWPIFLPIPLVLLFFALALRMSTYGVTPERYLLGLFGVVTAILLAMQLWPRVRGDLRAIAALPAVALLLAGFGPQGALAVSISSQAARFLEIVRDPPVEGKRHNEALEALSFLESRKALHRVAPEGTQISYEAGEGYRATALAWGLDPQRPTPGPQGFMIVDNSTPTVISFEGYDTVVQNVSLATNVQEPVSLKLPSGAELLLTLESGAIVATIGAAQERIRFPIREEEIQRIARLDRMNEVIQIPLTSKGRTIALVPTYIYADVGQPSQLQNLQATLLIREKDWPRP